MPGIVVRPVGKIEIRMNPGIHAAETVGGRIAVGRLTDPLNPPGNPPESHSEFAKTVPSYFSKDFRVWVCLF